MKEDWISAVEFIGKVLITAFTGVKVDFSAATSAPNLMTSGLIMIIYSTIKRFKAKK